MKNKPKRIYIICETISARTVTKIIGDAIWHKEGDGYCYVSTYNYNSEWFTDYKKAKEVYASYAKTCYEESKRTYENISKTLSYWKKRTSKFKRLMNKFPIKK